MLISLHKKLQIDSTVRQKQRLAIYHHRRLFCLMVREEEPETLVGLCGRRGRATWKQWSCHSGNRLPRGAGGEPSRRFARFSPRGFVSVFQSSRSRDRAHLACPRPSASLCSSPSAQQRATDRRHLYFPRKQFGTFERFVRPSRWDPGLYNRRLLGLLRAAQHLNLTKPPVLELSLTVFGPWLTAGAESPESTTAGQRGLLLCEQQLSSRGPEPRVWAAGGTATRRAEGSGLPRNKKSPLLGLSSQSSE